MQITILFGNSLMQGKEAIGKEAIGIQNARQRGNRQGGNRNTGERVIQIQGDRRQERGHTRDKGKEAQRQRGTK